MVAALPDSFQTIHAENEKNGEIPLAAEGSNNSMHSSRTKSTSGRRHEPQRSCLRRTSSKSSTRSLVLDESCADISDGSSTELPHVLPSSTIRSTSGRKPKPARPMRRTSSKRSVSSRSLDGAGDSNHTRSSAENNHPTADHHPKDSRVGKTLHVSKSTRRMGLPKSKSCRFNDNVPPQQGEGSGALQNVRDTITHTFQDCLHSSSSSSRSSRTATRPAPGLTKSKSLRISARSSLRGETDDKSDNKAESSNRALQNVRDSLAHTIHTTTATFQDCVHQTTARSMGLTKSKSFRTTRSSSLGATDKSLESDHHSGALQNVRDAIAHTFQDCMHPSTRTTMRRTCLAKSKSFRVGRRSGLCETDKNDKADYNNTEDGIDSTLQSNQMTRPAGLSKSKSFRVGRRSSLCETEERERDKGDGSDEDGIVSTRTSRSAALTKSKSFRTSSRSSLGVKEKSGEDDGKRERDESTLGSMPNSSLPSNRLPGLTKSKSFRANRRSGHTDKSDNGHNSNGPLLVSVTTRPLGMTKSKSFRASALPAGTEKRDHDISALNSSAPMSCALKGDKAGRGPPLFVHTNATTEDDGAMEQEETEVMLDWLPSDLKNKRLPGENAKSLDDSTALRTTASSLAQPIMERSNSWGSLSLSSTRGDGDSHYPTDEDRYLMVDDEEEDSESDDEFLFQSSAEWKGCSMSNGNVRRQRHAKLMAAHPQREMK